MTLLTFRILPAILLLSYGGLLTTWLQLYRRPDEHLERGALRFGWITLGVYLAWIGLITLAQSQIPVLSVGQICAFLGLLIWADQLYVHQKIAQRLLVILPLGAVIALLLIAVAAGVQPRPGAPEQVQEPWSAVHITISLAGLAMLFGGGVYGAGSLLLHRQLVSRRFGRLFSALPSLGDMHRLRTIALFVGWSLITLSLASSVVFMVVANEGTPSFFSHLHSMFALWLIVSLLALSERRNWLGDHRQARLAVGVSLLILLLVTASVLGMYTGGRS